MIFRTVIRTMLFLPPVVIAVWYLLGNVGAYAAGSTGLVAFGMFGLFSVISMVLALNVMITTNTMDPDY